jgi:tRNA G10  N-methylase Trm11
VRTAFRVFVPGKNWKLSLAELVSFLEARQVKFKVASFSKEFFVVILEESREDCSIADLGGFIKIGAVNATLLTVQVKEAFLHRDKAAQKEINEAVIASGLIGEMFNYSSGKDVFGVSVYCAEESLRPLSKGIQRFIGSSIKRGLTELGKKSSFMGFSKERKRPQLSHIEVMKKNMVENKAEVLFCVGKEQTFIATTIAVHNPFEFQKRDLEKPVQRKIFAISPRLARIMINLAGCIQRKVLLDPFCGVGTILQEGLLAKANVIGVDINRWCVEATVRNMEWVKSEYVLENAEYRVLQGDVIKLSQKIGFEQVDCVVTEPDLGPALRQIPTTSYALRIIEKLEQLFSGLLEEAYKVLRCDGRLVLVSPYIKTRSGKPIVMELKEKALDIGFESVGLFSREFFSDNVFLSEKLASMASFVDVGERHKIGREIHVFEK